MSIVLIVDDNPIDRRLAAGVVEKEGLETRFAIHGRAALDEIGIERPDIVLTDMLMPEMDGLELVEEIKANYSNIPVVLMTAHGSEEIAVKALQVGASSYVPKQNLARDLGHTLHDVLAIVQAKRGEEQAFDCLVEHDLRFQLGAEDLSHEPLIGFLQQQLKRWDLCGEGEMVRIGTALHEAFVNAIEHGNLELDSALRDEPNGAYQKLGKRRRRESPYCERKIDVSVKLSREIAAIKIRDQGPGFDPSSLPDPTDPENIGRISGRGLLLIRTFMDDVQFNETGNEITMFKRKVC